MLEKDQAKILQAVTDSKISDKEKLDLVEKLLKLFKTTPCPYPHYPLYNPFDTIPTQPLYPQFPYPYDTPIVTFDVTDNSETFDVTSGTGNPTFFSSTISFRTKDDGKTGLE